MQSRISIPLRHVFLGAALGIALLAAQSPGMAARPDPVVLSFATVGDSREEPGPHLNSQDRIWLQNTRAWARILREIQAKKPKILFFNGDMIMGYSTDKALLNRQYAFWRGMVANLLETGTYVIPVPGNHEVQEKFKDDSGKTKKIARAANEDLWRDNMGDLIIDPARWKAIMGTEVGTFDVGNTPAIGGPDPIQTNQSQLSYSFDHAGSHFAVINTDPVGNDGHAPVHWLREDLKQAKERGAKRLFVFGHKPARTYFFKPDIALEGMDKYPEHEKEFWQVIETAGANYFCGHEHIVNLMQPTKSTGGKAWQIMVGSGGSPFDAAQGDSKNVHDRMYAWAIVRLHASGKIHVDIYGFDEHYGKTKRLKNIDF